MAAIVLLMAIPATGFAGEPATDQYSPTVPGGGGNEPASDIDFGGGSGNSSGDDASGGSDATASPSADARDLVAPAVATDTGSTAATSTDTGKGGEKPTAAKDDEDRTLNGFAQAAESQRDAQVAAGGDVSHSQSGGDGMGPFLWIVLGLTLAWAIGFGITRQRRAGQPA
jgi:hypothetical protein